MLMLCSFLFLLIVQTVGQWQRSEQRRIASSDARPVLRRVGLARELFVHHSRQAGVHAGGQRRQPRSVLHRSARSFGSTSRRPRQLAGNRLRCKDDIERMPRRQETRTPRPLHKARVSSARRLPQRSHRQPNPRPKRQQQQQQQQCVDRARRAQHLVLSRAVDQSGGRSRSLAAGHMSAASLGSILRRLEHTLASAHSRDRLWSPPAPKATTTTTTAAKQATTLQ